MKRIIICCDGTWNTKDQHHPTNVAKVRQAVLSKGPDETLQEVRYIPGVGTGSLLDKLPGGVFGAGLWEKVQEAYREIVDIYDAGDELFFFGFSRGAYTARSAVGMVRKCGILRRDVEAGERARLIKDAYDLYRDRDLAPDADDMKEFRSRHCVHFKDPHFPDVPPIEFVGVWDTVGALGIPLGLVGRIFNRRHRFYDVSLSRRVKNAYHALAIDEKRGNFRPTLWEQHPDAADQKMEQRWFAGVHGDVGGAGPQSDWTLRWMLGKARGCGLALNEECIGTSGGGNGGGPIGESRRGFWKWLSYFSRPIGKGVPPKEATYLGGMSNETVDPAVVARNVADEKYMPPNLVAYYRENPAALEAAKKSRAGAHDGAA